ncbi:MAG: hypothetical protein QOK29_2873 [Rhodospirillaceae bacterium]|nr:hypothetical protein [Rhodospirillaceae bacterium]
MSASRKGSLLVAAPEPVGALAVPSRRSEQAEVPLRQGPSRRSLSRQNRTELSPRGAGRRNPPRTKLGQTPPGSFRAGERCH